MAKNKSLGGLAKHTNPHGYAYYWFRHMHDGSTFIALRDDEDGWWYMPGIDCPIADITSYATNIGKVPRRTDTGASIDD
jgi:hypothetical protein